MHRRASSLCHDLSWIKAVCRLCRSTLRRERQKLRVVVASTHDGAVCGDDTPRLFRSQNLPPSVDAAFAEEHRRPARLLDEVCAVPQPSRLVFSRFRAKSSVRLDTDRRSNRGTMIAFSRPSGSAAMSALTSNAGRAILVTLRIAPNIQCRGRAMFPAALQAITLRAIASSPRARRQ